MLSQCAEIVHAQFTLSKKYNPSDLQCLLSKEEIPEVWRASILGRVTGPIATHPSPIPTPPYPDEAATTAPLGGALGQDAAEMCIFEHGYDSERDYCIPEDESGTSGGVYVSLVANPERFTGYSGDHTNAIWREIYRENCFEIQPEDAEEEAMLSKSHNTQSEAKNDLEAIMLRRNKGQRASGATMSARV